MIKIGLTGGIGSGKTHIANIFIELGIPVFNADQVAKSLYDQPEVKHEVCSILGSGVYQSYGLDRNLVAKIIFNNPEKLESLNKVIHPAVEKKFLYWADSLSGKSLVIKEAAILFETGNYRSLDYNILVVAPQKLRLKRVLERDRLSKSEVQRRMKNQWSDEKKKGLADFIINNNETELLLPVVLEIYDKVLVAV